MDEFLFRISRDDFDAAVDAFVAKYGGRGFEKFVHEQPELGVRTVVLAAHRTLAPRQPTAVAAAATADAVRWSDDDDDDERVPDCSPSAAAAAPPLQATYFVTFSECFQLPQLHFLVAPLLDVDSLSAAYLPAVRPLSDDAAMEGRGVIVAPGMCDELGRAMLSLHQCDTASMLGQAASAGVPISRESLLEHFVRVVGPLVGLSF